MIIGIVQARMSSQRLPGKVLLPILGIPMLQLLIERLKHSRRLSKIIVATSESPDDQPIVNLCDSMKIDCYQGNLNDVLDRYYHASKKYNPEYIVRITGDCPLHDAQIIDQMIDVCEKDQYDFVTNTIEPTYPDGQDTWVFSYKTLEKTWQEAKTNSDREHVCPYMISHPELFKTLSVKAPHDNSAMRWTVDEPADFSFVKSIYEALYYKNKDFSTKDVLMLLSEFPERFQMNISARRDEGLSKSLHLDRQDRISKTGIDISSSLNMQNRAKRVLPGQSQLLSKRIDQFSEGVWPGYYHKSKGAEITDLDGNTYIDMSIGGIGATVLGYADNDVDTAVKRAVDLGVATSLCCPEEVELAELLCELHPWAEKVRFTRSGGEAMAVAIRVARAATGKSHIAFCGYHGWHDWYLSANLETEDNLAGHLLPGLSPAGVPQELAGTIHPFCYNKLDELESICNSHGTKIGAIVMEPIRNAQPAPGFLEGIRLLADKIGAVLIFDEITSAFRLNNGGAHLLYNVVPDIAVFAKAIGNGYAIAAVIGKANVMETFQKTFISSTNWTERIGPSAALACIHKFISLDASKHLINMGQSIQRGWQQAAKESGLILDIGGIYPLSHFNFEKQHLECKAYFIQLMLEKGFLASNLFYAMYSHRSWHVNSYLEAINDSFISIKSSLDADNISSKLRGKVAASGFKRLN